MSIDTQSRAQAKENAILASVAWSNFLDRSKLSAAATIFSHQE